VADWIFVAIENGFVLCGTDIRGRIGVAGTKVWIPLYINGICKQWRARGCGEPDVEGKIS
jgi:hypothetical protein